MQQLDVLSTVANLARSRPIGGTDGISVDDIDRYVDGENVRTATQAAEFGLAGDRIDWINPAMIRRDGEQHE